MKSSLVCASPKLHIFHILHVLPVFDGQIRLYLAKKITFCTFFSEQPQKNLERKKFVFPPIYFIYAYCLVQFLKKENFGN